MAGSAGRSYVGWGPLVFDDSLKTTYGAQNRPFKPTFRSACLCLVVGLWPKKFDTQAGTRQIAPLFGSVRASIRLKMPDF